MLEAIPMSIAVTVNDNNGTYTWTYDPPTNPSNVIETLGQGNYQLTFTLQGNVPATWAPGTDWIHWTNGECSPSGVTVQSPNGNQAVLLVDNTVRSQEELDFTLKVVTSNGETVTSPDPDIILDPP
jgi:hypothetical protein